MRSQKVFKLVNYFKWRWLHKIYRPLTMTTRKFFLDNLFVASYHLQRHKITSGCYVECGTWAGGMSFAMMQVLPQISEWHFFDSFEGLPPATDLDGDIKLQQERGELYHDNNRADYEEFRKNLTVANHRQASVSVHKGWFEETLPTFQPGQPIAVLRLDGDWYDSTMTCLENLFDKVMTGGLIIIDDYHDHPGCSRAVHDFLSARKAEERIHMTPNRVAYIIKK